MTYLLDTFSVSLLSTLFLVKSRRFHGRYTNDSELIPHRSKPYHSTTACPRQAPRSQKNPPLVQTCAGGQLVLEPDPGDRRTPKGRERVDNRHGADRQRHRGEIKKGERECGVEQSHDDDRTPVTTDH